MSSIARSHRRSHVDQRHAVDFPDTRSEQEALFRDARAPDVERGGHCDADAAIMRWSHH
jgi:hypothetical protein